MFLYKQAKVALNSMLRNLFERCNTIKIMMTSMLIRGGFGVLASYLANVLEAGGILH